MQYGTAKLVLDEKKNPPGPGSTITSDYARVVSIRSLIESDIADIGNKYYEDHDTKLLIDPRDIEVGSDDDRARLQANDDSSWAGLGSTGKWYSLPIHVPGLKKVSETCASHNEIPRKTEMGIMMTDRTSRQMATLGLCLALMRRGTHTQPTES